MSDGCQIRGNLSGNADGNPEPSLRNKEGVETRRHPPKTFVLKHSCHGEGIVQATKPNFKFGGG